MNKYVKLYSYVGLLAFAGLGSIIIMFCKGQPQFAIAMLLFVVWAVLGLYKVTGLPTKSGLHATDLPFFLHGLYVLLFLFAMIGNIGYLFYYGFAVFASATIVLAFIHIIAYMELSKLPDVYIK